VFTGFYVSPVFNFLYFTFAVFAGFYVSPVFDSLQFILIPFLTFSVTFRTASLSLIIFSVFISCHVLWNYFSLLSQISSFSLTLFHCHYFPVRLLRFPDVIPLTLFHCFPVRLLRFPDVIPLSLFPSQTSSVPWRYFCCFALSFLLLFCSVKLFLVSPKFYTNSFVMYNSFPHYP